MNEFIRTRNIKQWLAAFCWALLILVIAADYVRMDKTWMGILLVLVNGTLFAVAAMSAHKKWF